VLTKIVKYIRARHQDGDDHPLTLDELLDETNQLDVGTKVKTVLILLTYYNIMFISKIKNQIDIIFYILLL